MTLAPLCHRAHGERVSIDPFDNELGAGVRTVRHAPADEDIDLRDIERLSELEGTDLDSVWSGVRARLRAEHGDDAAAKIVDFATALASRIVTATPTRWIDAPTHDGLWWVLGRGEGADIALFSLTRHHGDIWRIRGIGFEDMGRLHPAWRYAPAIQPAAPTDDAPATHFDEPPEIP